MKYARTIIFVAVPVVTSILLYLLCGLNPMAGAAIALMILAGIFRIFSF